MSAAKILPEAIRAKLMDFPEYRMGVHRVALQFKDGRTIEDVFVAWEREIVRVGESMQIAFDPEEIVDIEDRSGSKQYSVSSHSVSDTHEPAANGATRHKT